MLLLLMLALSSEAKNSVVIDGLTNASDGIVYLDPMKAGKLLFARVVIAQIAYAMSPYRKLLKKVLIDGLWIEWFADGGLESNANRGADRRHAMRDYFQNNGSLRQKEFYVEDQPVGIQTEYDESGRILKESYYIKGKAINIKQ